MNDLNNFIDDKNQKEKKIDDSNHDEKNDDVDLKYNENHNNNDSKQNVD